MTESSAKEKKTLWEKKKLLVTSKFSFSHSVFKRLVQQTCKIQGLFGKGLRKKPFENNVGKGQNAGNQHFLLFQQCFQYFPSQISNILTHLFCCLQMLSIWTNLKICRFEELNVHQMMRFVIENS